MKKIQNFSKFFCYTIFLKFFHSNTDRRSVNNEKSAEERNPLFRAYPASLRSSPAEAQQMKSRQKGLDSIIYQ